ncbi:hypothetical protein EJ08DRAFT_647721 [Tothia fuscella]|uniref:Uncharacterized protein n=1 Tax=Tothia fuscella TaxID=1048955 RepID=A0A9P4NX85_9PEZI|nr:hypothetical protein EJ08DRAFT_647721 [Tothia fuscella]
MAILVVMIQDFRLSSFVHLGWVCFSGSLQGMRRVEFVISFFLVKFRLFRLSHLAFLLLICLTRGVWPDLCCDSLVTWIDSDGFVIVAGIGIGI